MIFRGRGRRPADESEDSHDCSDGGSSTEVSATCNARPLASNSEVTLSQSLTLTQRNAPHVAGGDGASVGFGSAPPPAPAAAAAAPAAGGEGEDGAAAAPAAAPLPAFLRAQNVAAVYKAEGSGTA